MVIQLAFRSFIIGIKAREQTLNRLVGCHYVIKEMDSAKESPTAGLSGAHLAVLIPRSHLR